MAFGQVAVSMAVDSAVALSKLAVAVVHNKRHVATHGDAGTKIVAKKESLGF